MRKHTPLPQVVIMGRSNVGKSTLFNKIAEQNRALVTKTAGTTRDYLEATIAWRDKIFDLIDTGGLDPAKDDLYGEQIIKQSQLAQSRAQILLFVVDSSSQILEQDKKIARLLRKHNKKVILVVNKCDTKIKRDQSEVFKRLGFDFFTVSASNGSGVGDLLDGIVNELPQAKKIDEKPNSIIALIGQPNVGKSSLLNSLYGEERMIVSPIAHTTRDSQDVLVAYKAKNNNPEKKDIIFKIIDTAGIRRRASGEEVEKLSVNKSVSAIKRSTVTALVLDISKKITSQDKRLIKEIADINKGLFIIANKWDLVPEKDSITINKYKDYLDGQFPFLSWAPIIFTSAQDRQRISNILDLAWDIQHNLGKEINENALSKFLKKIVAKRKPTIGKGTRRPRLLRLKQTSHNPVEFLLEIPNKTNMAISYKSYIVKSLREHFDFEGVPIKLRVKEVMPKKGENFSGGEKKLKSNPTHGGQKNRLQKRR